MGKKLFREQLGHLVSELCYFHECLVLSEDKELAEENRESIRQITNDLERLLDAIAYIKFKGATD